MSTDLRDTLIFSAIVAALVAVTLLYPRAPVDCAARNAQRIGGVLQTYGCAG